MRNHILFLFFTVMSGAISLRAMNAPKVSASIRSEVHDSNGVFSYYYTLTNDRLSTSSIWTLSIDISRDAGTLVLSKNGLNDGPCVVSDLSTTIESSPSTAPIVPVTLDCPSGWLASLSAPGTASWAGIDETSLIHAGQVLDGYQIRSQGLPGLRSFRLEPHLNIADISLTPPDGPAGLDRYQSELQTFIDNASTLGITVAPTAPPADFQPVQFLQTIQNYKEQSFKQGWITNAGVANSLDVKLNAALAALQAQDIATAKNVLNALLNEIQAQNGKDLTSEAVALLEFNTQYLLSKLP